MAGTTFEAALRLVLRHEGGYADHPSDPGGATMRGITLRTYADWLGRTVSKAELRAIRIEDVAAIYRARYWDVVRGDALPAGLDLALFDLAVNSGPKRAVVLLQRALGIAEDGRLGPATLAAIGARSTGDLIRRLSVARLGFLERLPTFPVFGRGWQKRVAETERVALRIAAEPQASSQTQPKENAMLELTKTFLSSRTLWANAIGMIALVLSWLGFDTGALDKGALTEAIFQVIAGASFVASSIFRVLATKRLA